MSLAAATLVAASIPLVIPGQPSVRPWPIGPGPAYRPAAAGAAVEHAEPIGPLTCTSGSARFEFHLELFANRRVIVVPAGVGVAAPAAEDGAEVVPRRCTYPLWTIAPGGVVEVRGAPGRYDLAELFRVWGQALGARRIGSFTSAVPLRAYVAGRAVHGPIGQIPLTAHAEIVLELGGYLAPHALFLFSGDGT